jgi:hypothetical protein
MRVDNNGNYKVYAIKVTLKNHMEFGIFAASLPALERAYAAIDQQQLLIPEQPFSCFELNKATLCKGWDLVCESNEMLARRVVKLTEELTTAHSMHVDNERYKWERLGFGCLDELIEHYKQLYAQAQTGGTWLKESNTHSNNRATKYPAGHCKHGVILYGNECLQCTRESEQGQGGAA